MLLGLAAPSLALGAGPYVYVTDDAPVHQFAASASGALSPLTVTVTPGGGRGIAVSPDGTSVYASGGNVVSQYNVTGDGTLSPMSPATVPALNEEGGDADVGSVVVSPDGRSVYAASLPNGVGGGSVVQFDRAADGKLTPKTPSAVSIGEGQTLAITPDGKYLYATSNYDIKQFTVSAFDGKLTPNGQVSATGYTSGLASSPDSSTLWATNYDGNTVSQWTIGSTGALTAKSTATVDTGQAPFGIAVSPDGKSVYIANSGDQTLSQYNVSLDGSLSAKTTATVGTAMGSLGVAVSADGASVYVANSGSGTVSQFDAAGDGSLSAKTPASVSSGTHPRNIGLKPPPPPPDINPPDTRIVGGPTDGGKTNDDTPTLTFEASEPGSTFTCQLDSDPEFACTSPYTTATLSDGSHTFSVAATDAATNTDSTPAQRTFTVDTVAPQTNITGGPADGATTTDTSPSFSFGSSESGSTFECRIDAGLPFSCSSPAVVGPLAPGAHTFAVVATDQAGNHDPTPASRAFWVAAPALPAVSVPGAPGAPTATAGDGQATVSWTAPISDGGAPITSYTVTASPGGQTCTWASGPMQCTVTGLTNGTPYTFTMRASNSAGSGPESAASAAVTPLAALPSPAQIAASLKAQLAPSGKGARIAALLKRGQFGLPLSALTPGTAAINWYLVPAGARLAKAKPVPILVASGKAAFTAPGKQTVGIKLTKAGKRGLKHAKRLKLTARATFTATGQPAVTATRAFTLKR